MEGDRLQMISFDAWIQLCLNAVTCNGFSYMSQNPFKSETIWIGFLSYEPIRVLTNSVSLFWRRESKLLRMACKALRTQHSCSTPQCLWGPYSFHPILVPPWMPLSRMHFRLVCLENSFSFPQILPSSNYFSVCLFFLCSDFPRGTIFSLMPRQAFGVFLLCFLSWFAMAIYSFASPRGKGSVFKCVGYLPSLIQLLVCRMEQNWTEHGTERH